MRSQVGPVSKELTSVEAAEAFLGAAEVGVVYFGGDSKLKGLYSHVLFLQRSYLINASPRKEAKSFNAKIHCLEVEFGCHVFHDQTNLHCCI